MMSQNNRSGLSPSNFSSNNFAMTKPSSSWSLPSASAMSVPSASAMSLPSSSSQELLSFPNCEDVSNYQRIAKIGQGTFGEVFKAKCLEKDDMVAMKKILMDNETEGFPITALREINILMALKHENVVRLLSICRQNGYKHKTGAKEGRGRPNRRKAPYEINAAQFFLVFEFCEHDLAGLLSNKSLKFSLGEIKMIAKQLLNGLFYIHVNQVLHRDLKTSNILMTKNGVLKIADFGLSRAFSQPRNNQPNRYTNRVVTLWYRPPELLLGERNYGPPVDMWGAGCIMAELWTRYPILRGGTEQKQLHYISTLCGSITPRVWPSVTALSQYQRIELPQNFPRKTRDRLMPYLQNEEAMDLLDKLLVLDPSRRLEANSALDHDFFWTDPMPCSLSDKLSTLNRSMFELHIPSNSRHPVASNLVASKPTAKNLAANNPRQRNPLITNPLVKNLPDTKEDANPFMDRVY